MFPSVNLQALFPATLAHCVSYCNPTASPLTPANQHIIEGCWKPTASPRSPVIGKVHPRIPATSPAAEPSPPRVYQCQWDKQCGRRLDSRATRDDVLNLSLKKERAVALGSGCLGSGRQVSFQD